MKAFDLSHLALKLGSVPLPGLSGMNSVPGESDMLSYGSVSDIFVKSELSLNGNVHPKNLGSKSSASLKRMSFPDKSVVQRAVGATSIPGPLRALAEVLLPESSLLAESALLTSIPEDLYKRVGTTIEESSQLSNSGSFHLKAESDVDVDPDVVEDGSSAARGRSFSPMRTRGSARNGKHARRVDAKVGRPSAIPEQLPLPVTTVENWAQCESCKKWRRLPVSVDTDKLPDLWVCSLNIWDPSRNSCDVPEETFPEMSHINDPQKSVSSGVTTENLNVLIRPVTAPSTGRGHSGRFTDHEVLEMLFSGNREHPLHNRLTIHSLDKNSLLASELPHDVLVVEDMPPASVMGLESSVTHDPKDLIRPDEELLKEDGVARDDGILSIGFANKTRWSFHDNDASTIDSVEESDMCSKASASCLSAMFPRLALQVPRSSKLLSPRTKRGGRFVRRFGASGDSDVRAGRLRGSDVASEPSAALSAMNHEDLIGIFSAYVDRTGKKDVRQGVKHCLIEGKIRSSGLPVDSFLQPLSILAMPLSYPVSKSTSKSSPIVRPGRSCSKSVSKVGRPAGSGRSLLDVVELKSDSKRKSVGRPVKGVSGGSDRHIRRLREEYVRSSDVRVIEKRLGISNGDIDYSYRDSKRPSKRGIVRSSLSLSEPVVVSDVPSGSLDKLLMMELSTPIDYPPSSGSNDRSVRSPFGLGMGRAMEMLTQPIDMVSLSQPSTVKMGRSGRGQPGCPVAVSSSSSSMALDHFSKPLF
ncbi:uncharacterized protein BXIN_0573 [Babesia sp. Xinjiang]|uniref:uncharacterized protein n=1 Tax=Babesia sp. Xinjiang TaxID=462227 RepID=UPI000A230E4B|nr:uncharacterized protein BXIN_0573 [Babesia sp. Xinjiang]ORM41845.1 hypothetical protein BXIN_0573 [Babesia sp. Xinjiang]